MKHKVSELEGALLDAAVAMAEGWEQENCFWWLASSVDRTNPAAAVARVDSAPFVFRGTDRFTYGDAYRPSAVWTDGGPIIERERITVGWRVDMPAGAHQWDALIDAAPSGHGFGPTPLIAAMRAYVASKLGAEVELP